MMLEALFGNQTIERVLFYLLTNEEGYAYEMQRHVGGGLYPIQRALERLESGGILVAQVVGRTRVYRFNPRYPFQEELLNFLQRAYGTLPDKQKKQMYEPIVRRRPRKQKKPL